MQTTTLRSLSPEVLDSVLSEYIFSPTDLDQREKVMEHFASLLKTSSLLRIAVDEWGSVALEEGRIADLFTLGLYVGFQCRYSIEEGRRLARPKGAQ